jgi:hypothetical protein
VTHVTKTVGSLASDLINVFNLIVLYCGTRKRVSGLLEAATSQLIESAEVLAIQYPITFIFVS